VRVAIWPVHVEGWVLGSGFDRAAVGEQVTWRLRFFPLQELVAGASCRTFELNAESWSSASGDSGGLLLRAGGLRAFWPTRETKTGRLSLAGRFYGGGDPSPAVTTGIVRRVQIVTTLYRMGLREYLPVPGTDSFRDVDRIPRLIDAHLRQDEDSQTLEHEIVVDLDVSDNDDDDDDQADPSAGG
jgi:hypothetical protein